jgi:hypothetical protein
MGRPTRVDTAAYTCHLLLTLAHSLDPDVLQACASLSPVSSSTKTDLTGRGHTRSHFRST